MGKFKIEDVEEGDIVTVVFPEGCGDDERYMAGVTITGPAGYFDEVGFMIGGNRITRDRAEFITAVEKKPKPLPTEPGIYVTRGYAEKTGDAFVFQLDRAGTWLVEGAFQSGDDVHRRLACLNDGPLVRLVPEVTA